MLGVGSCQPRGPVPTVAVTFDRLDGWLWPEEGERLAVLASKVPADQTIVELGSFKGKSACWMASRSRVPVHCVDLWDDPQVRARFDEQVAVCGFDHRIVAHQHDTASFAAEWSDPVGLLFIDADHSFAGCLADWEAWSPLVAPGGVVAFHDYTTWFPGVREVVDEHVIPDPAWRPQGVTRGLFVTRRRTP